MVCGFQTLKRGGKFEGAGSGPEQAKLKALLETVALERQKEAKHFGLEKIHEMFGTKRSQPPSTYRIYKVGP